MTGSHLLYSELHYNGLMTDWGLPSAEATQTLGDVRSDIALAESYSAFSSHCFAMPWAAT